MAHKPDIDNIRVAVFGTSGYPQAYTKATLTGATPTENNTTYTFTVLLPVYEGEAHVHIIANGDSSITYENQTEHTIMSKMTSTGGVGAYWARIILKDGILAKWTGNGTMQTNTNKNTKGLDKGADRLEIPKLSDKDLQLFIVKQTSGIDRTYSLEWDCTKKANRWVALQMHDGLPDKSVGRNGGWQDDSDIPSQYQTHDADYKGTPFSRGHMCASSDRQTTVAQNRQTFIMSNIHPQYQNHNGNLWQTLETQVQKWGYSSVYRDTLYVVKAGKVYYAAQSIGRKENFAQDQELMEDFLNSMTTLT